MLLEYDVKDGTGPRSGVRRRALAAVVSGLSVIAVASCVYDSSNRCGPHQVLRTDSVAICVCDEHSASTADGCVPCGPNEIPGANGCQCAPGYDQRGPGEPCTAATNVDSGTGDQSAQGAECDPAANPCTDPTYNYCFVEAGKSGYCTSEQCTSNDDCNGGYVCDSKVSPSICRRPPLGLGKPCSSTSDCAGTEATFCDVVVTKACAVQGCSLTPDNCLPGYVCCDLSKYGLSTTLCVLGGCV